MSVLNPRTIEVRSWMVSISSATAVDIRVEIYAPYTETNNYFNENPIILAAGGVMFARVEIPEGERPIINGTVGANMRQIQIRVTTGNGTQISNTTGLKVYLSSVLIEK